MAGFSLFDMISLALVLILGLKGIINGLVKEVFGLLGIIGGIYFAFRYPAEAGKMINDHLFVFGNQASLQFFGFITILIVFWVACIFLGYIIAQALSLSGLSMLDKLAGCAVGSVKIFLVFSAFAAAISEVSFIQTRIQPYVANSVMFPLFLETGHYIIVKLDTNTMFESLQPKENTNP